MQATLYLPGQSPRTVSTEGLVLPDPATGCAAVPAVVPELLNCRPGLVDILACGPSYVVYSVFDCEDELNPLAMTVVANVTGVSFDLDDEDAALCGAVLVVTE